MGASLDRATHMPLRSNMLLDRIVPPQATRKTFSDGVRALVYLFSSNDRRGLTDGPVVSEPNRRRSILLVVLSVRDLVSRFQFYEIHELPTL